MSLIYSRPRIKLPKFLIINHKRNTPNNVPKTSNVFFTVSFITIPRMIMNIKTIVT